VAPPGTFDRLERVALLMHLSWCAVHLQLITPAFIAKKRFASPGLDVDAHLSDQIAKLQRRLAIARQAIAGPDTLPVPLRLHLVQRGVAAT
jgi:hypothetical protein